MKKGFYTLLYLWLFILPLTGLAQSADEGSVTPRVQLAKVYDKSSTVDVSEYLVSEKFDGVRGYWNGSAMLTRSGNVIPLPPWLQAQFDQHAPLGRVVKRLADLRQSLRQKRQTLPVDQFKSTDGFAGVVAGQSQQRNGSSRVLHCEQRGSLRDRDRRQPQRGGSDNPQRALGADQQVFQVITRVVFAQTRQPAPDVSRRQHRLQPQAEVACIAIAQHVDAAGIGRKVAADPG